MDDKLKERLTGAAVLVALVVIFVPAMFRGAPAPERGQRMEPAPEAGPEAVLDATQEAPAGGADANAGSMQATNSAAPVAAAPVTSAPAARSPDQAASIVPVPTPAMPVAPALTAASAASTSTPVSAPSPSPSPSPAPSAVPAATSAHSGWVVQLGSFKQRENAARLVKSAAAKGFKSTIAGPDDRGFFRVRTAVVADRETAMALRERLKSAGINGILGSAP